MPKLTTASVGLAITPTIVSTLLSHYLNRKRLHRQPTAHLSFHEALHLIRGFLEYASQHTVEETQEFTAQRVPHPAWVRVDEVAIAEEHVARSGEILAEQLGEDGLRRVGGRCWWQWRKPDEPLRGEWIEMSSDYKERRQSNDAGRRVMLYVHGGAYYFGSVDTHRYMLQRHARKLKARVFAPRYRLSPQFPFPCGLQDCVAAYLHLLASRDPSTIILAGDSAGGGLVLSILVTLRDRGLPRPCGAVLVSPWCDLTHSFPSVSGENPLDYIPPSGFHHKPSRAWPPPNEDDLAVLRTCANGHHQRANDARKSKSRAAAASPAGAEEARKDIATPTPVPSAVRREMDQSRLLTLDIDGQDVVIKEQIQMYTTNDMLSHPLVSPIMQASLGGLPPLLIIVGGGEMLRDEQIYLAHKCANPRRYLPPEGRLDETGRAQVDRYEPTDVQLQIWDGLCHVAPTLSFTRPAKYIFRSIARFGAWALARAQHTGIDILVDDDISVISSSDTEQEDEPNGDLRKKGSKNNTGDRREGAAADARVTQGGTVEAGKAGDSLPRFVDHMVRQRITRHGFIYKLEGPDELAGCTMPREEIGTIGGNIARRWLATRSLCDRKYAAHKARVQDKIIEDMAAGLQEFEGERPPPGALAGRRRMGSEMAAGKKTRGIGMALWSLWGSKHDEITQRREQKADQPAGTLGQNQTARDVSRPDDQIRFLGMQSRRRTVVDEQQTGQSPIVSPDTHGPKNGDKGQSKEAGNGACSSSSYGLSAQNLPQGVTGKRVFIDGIAMPFSLGKKGR